MDRRSFLQGLAAAVVAAPVIAQLEWTIDNARISWQSAMFDWGNAYGIAIRIKRPGDIDYRHALRVEKGGPHWKNPSDKPPEETIELMKTKLLEWAKAHA